jgi:multiple sugar transport system permease protein
MLAYDVDKSRNRSPSTTATLRSPFVDLSCTSEIKPYRLQNALRIKARLHTPTRKNRREPYALKTISTPMRLRRADKIFIASVLVPVFAHFLFFFAGPVVLSFVTSFTSWAIKGAPRFVGVANYERLLHDATFHRALLNTFLFTLYFVPPMLATSLGLALLVNAQSRAAAVFKTLYFLPVVTSFVVFALIFGWIFQAGPNSLANKFIGIFHIPAQSWLQNEHQSLPLLALLGILKGAGWNMVYFIGGLQAIPDTFYEAARVDGASRWVIFRRITLPLLRPTIYFVLVLTTIGAFQVFDSAYVLTAGGPALSTTTIVYFIYEAGFESFQMGYASASAYVLLALVVLVTWLQKRYLGAAADWY